MRESDITHTFNALVAVTSNVDEDKFSTKYMMGMCSVGQQEEKAPWTEDRQ